jgi:hypothetical protein
VQEALAHVVIVGGTQQVGRGAGILAAMGVLAPGLLHGLGQPRPLHEPCAIVAQALAQS